MLDVELDPPQPVARAATVIAIPMHTTNQSRLARNLFLTKTRGSRRMGSNGMADAVPGRVSVKTTVIW